MAFEMLKTDYKDDILNTSVNQLRRYTIVNNADGTISLIDSTAYSTVGTFIGAKDINLICKNMNTIMGYIETSSGDLAQEFQDYFAEQKGIFEDNVEAYMQDFQNASQTQFTVWYDANTAAWSQEVENRINAIIASLTELVEDNGPFVLNKAYRVGNLLTWNIGDGITRGYLVINPVPANMGIYPSNKTYFMEVTREGAQGVGLGMTPRGNWRSIITYVENDWVVHNWVYWLCLNENTDSEPSESNANWEKIYDITADMPIQFDEPEENSLSFMEILSNIISGQTLGNLFKHIKGSFIKLLKKFGDTEYTATGTSITYDTSNDSFVEISNVGTSTDDFYIISENDSSLNLAGLGDYEISGLIASVEHKIVTIDGDYSNTNRQIPLDLDLTAGDYIFKIIPLGGTINGIVTFKYLTRNPSNYYELKAETTSNSLSDVEFTMDYSPNYGNFSVIGASGTTVDNYSFMVVVCKKDAEYKADAVLVKAGDEQEKYILNTFEGKTKVFTTSMNQVSFTAEFKTRFWNLSYTPVEEFGQDLDTYIREGRFWISNDLGGVNAPAMDSGWLTVKKSTITDVSPNVVVIRQDFEAALVQKTYYRYGIVKGEVTWGVWKSVLTSADISHNLATTNPDMVLGADMGKVLNDSLDAFGIVKGTIASLTTSPPGTISSDSHVRKQGSIAYCSFALTTSTTITATTTTKIATVSILPVDMPYVRFSVNTGNGIAGLGHLTNTGELYVRFNTAVSAAIEIRGNFTYEA